MIYHEIRISLLHGLLFFKKILT